MPFGSISSLRRRVCWPRASCFSGSVAAPPHIAPNFTTLTANPASSITPTRKAREEILCKRLKDGHFAAGYRVELVAYGKIWGKAQQQSSFIGNACLLATAQKPADLGLFAAWFYLLKQDLVRAAFSANLRETEKASSMNGRLVSDLYVIALHVRFGR